MKALAQVNLTKSRYPGGTIGTRARTHTHTCTYTPTYLHVHITHACAYRNTIV